jgi:two-component system, NtrC family, sensor kinase
VENICNPFNHTFSSKIDLYLAPGIEITDNYENIQFVQVDSSNYTVAYHLDYFSLKYLNKTILVSPKLSTILNCLNIKRKNIPLPLHQYSDLFSKHIANNFDLTQTLQAVLRTGNINPFEAADLILHEKGSSQAQKIEITKRKINSYKFSTSDFIQLYKSIKKSKTSYFSTNTFQGIALNIIGTFTAFTYTFKTHDVIFIFSTGSFLPIEKGARIEIDEFIKIFPTILENFLLLSQTLQKHDKINDISKLINKSNSENNYSFTDQDYYHKERIELLGELLNTLKHELSNPLFGLKLGLDLLSIENASSETTEILSEFSNALKRSNDIIEQFSDIYQSNVAIKNISLKNLLEEIFTLTKSKSRNIKKIILCPNDITLKTNQTLFAQIIFNLIINSVESLNENNVDNPQIRIEVLQDKNTTRIIVTDNGPGIPVELQNKIFTPFFTTKVNGTGIGLPLCRSLASKIGATLEYSVINYLPSFTITFNENFNENISH